MLLPCISATTSNRFPSLAVAIRFFRKLKMSSSPSSPTSPAPPPSVSISNAGSTSPVAAAPAAVPTPAAAAAQPAINFATEWLDELGRVCPKNVDYATQCPKGHALAPFDGSGEPPAQQPSDADVICRVCHGSTQRGHARGWLTCSVAGCCGGYAVCAACVTILGSPLQRATASTDSFCMMVTLFAHAAILRHHICSGCSHACVLTSSVREYRWSI